ncbi:hypothetical protein V3C99_017550 [Haemonchus contortus]
MEVSVLRFNVNGKDVKVYNVDPETSLADYLRNELGLTGVKLSCEWGACGSCTVTLGKWNHKLGKATYKAINACIYPLYMAHHKLILTIEGIGNSNRLHPIQERLARSHGTQCGFCSPGFVMAAYGLLREYPDASIHDIKHAVKGNLCRCTGYRPILRALYSCCNESNSDSCVYEENGRTITNGDLFESVKFPVIDETQEILFPPSLIMENSASDLYLEGARVKLLAPVSWKDIDDCFGQYNEVKILSSGQITRINSALLQHQMQDAIWVSVHNLPSMEAMEVTQEEVSIGAALSIMDLARAMYENCDRGLGVPVWKYFEGFLSVSVMNNATWVGSLIDGRSDSSALLLAFNPKIVIRELGGAFTVGKVADFVDDDQGTVKLKRGSIIVATVFPRSQRDIRLFMYKKGQRPDGDSTVVNFVAVIRVAYFIEEARIAITFGLRTTLCKKISLCLRGKRLNGLKRHLNELLLAIDDDIAQYSSISDFNYKRNLIRAAVCELCDNPDQSIEGPEVPVEPLQLYSEWSHDDAGPSEYAESEAYVTGEALYFNDINTEDVLHAAVVLSTEAHAKILRVDTTEALSLDGVMKYVDIHDIPRGGTNYPGTLLRDIFGPDDTPMFADGEVLAFGQLIGLVVARDPVTARRAATLVKVHYQELPAVLTMEQAIQLKSYHLEPHEFGVSQDVVERELLKSEIVIEGTTRIGCQEHGYLETQGSIAIPGEREEWVIHTTTQSMNLHQLFTAAVLGVPAQNVTVKVKHVGGSFGGKYTQSALTGAWAAVAAYALNRPVKVRLTRFEDMFVTGKRHPAMVKYKVGVSTSGLLRCAYLKVYLDGGYAVDTSHVVAYLSTALSDTCYNIPVMRAEGYALKTNKSNNTAMRANGMPQAFFAMNGILSHVAHAVHKPLEKIMEMNFNKGGGVRLSGEPIPNDALLECWDECLQFSEFDRIRKDVNRFNATSKNVKLGIALSATRMGLAHPGANEQAEALVQICMDGSVEIKIGGIEMGQGLNTKCIQIASRTLGIPISLIKIVDASTDNTCNDPAAGGSQDATAHGRAVQACCERLMVGLRAILKEEPDWCQAVQKAYNMRLPLKASEHTRIDREKNGIPLQSSVYNTTGVACIVSQVNCLTGDHHILSVDIVMDAGRSLNPAVDIGQIEGALMMSYGNFTCEDLAYDDKGKMSNDMFSRYKFPSSLMTPKRFRVKLLKRSDGSEGQIYSSKSVGDPATVLGVGIYASLRYAITARRQDIGRTKFFEIAAPLTASRILSYCNPP